MELSENKIVMIEGKMSGFQQTSPQDSPVETKTDQSKHECKVCMIEYKSKAYLEAHMKTRYLIAVIVKKPFGLKIQLKNMRR